MTDLNVRKLLVDLSGGFGRHWLAGDAFRSQFYNALSMSFPVGEQFFMDAVKAAAARLPDTPDHAALRQTLRGFSAQEATHRHVHGLYNAQLEAQGLVNRWQDWARARIARTRGFHPLHDLAVTCAYEHCTAVLADMTLRHPEDMAGADPRLQTVWFWHAAEETEHKAVAFDLYQRLGGNYRWRLRWYLVVLTLFVWDATRQTLLNLWRDGSLWRPGTWWSALRFFWGRRGLVWRTTGPLLAYLRRDFHPDHCANQHLAQAWLDRHSTQFRVVGGAQAPQP